LSLSAVRRAQKYLAIDPSNFGSTESLPVIPIPLWNQNSINSGSLGQWRAALLAGGRAQRAGWGRLQLRVNPTPGASRRTLPFQGRDEGPQRAATLAGLRAMMPS